MRHQPRKALIKYAPVDHRVNREGMYRRLAERRHRHTCTEATCRLTYEDNCEDPATNGRCHTCRGRRRPWVDSLDSRTSLDPRPCCVNNTVLIHEPEDLLRSDCAGPGPWFQCQTCKRTHGHPCTDPALIERPVVAAKEGHA